MRAARCEMVIGFLVPHRCPNAATGQCIQCGRQFCDEHLEVTEHGLMCQACREGRDEPVASGSWDDDYSDSDYHVFEADDDEVFVDLS